MANTFIKIQTVTVGSGGAATIDFTSIPQTYTDLKVFISPRNASGGLVVTDISAKFNGSTTGYYGRLLYGEGSSALSAQGSSGEAIWIAEGAGSSTTANIFGNSTFYIPNYTSAKEKNYSTEAVNENNATNAIMLVTAGLWSNTAAITSISIFNSNPAGNFAQYTTATLYGIINT
jgi:hypothetical protein